MDPADLALLIWGAFGAFGIVLRIVVQWRTTGSTGVHGLSGEPGSVEWFGGLLFVAAIAMGVGGAVAQQDGTIDPIADLDGSLGNAVGGAVALAGLLATLYAQLAMGRSWRIGVDPGERTDLVTGGPFSLVRNPIYSAMLLGNAGMALLIPNPLAIAGLAALTAGLELQTRVVEEPHLREVHGDAYARYAARVGRFLPGVGRLR